MTRTLILQIIFCLNGWYFLAEGGRCFEEFRRRRNYETNLRDSGTFYRAGFPDLEKRPSLGKAVVLRCGHFSYTESNPPPIRLMWYKNGKRLRPVQGKIIFSGCNERPPYRHTTLRIIRVDENDTGRYSCRLSLKNASDNDTALLIEKFTVTVTDPEGRELRPLTTFKYYTTATSTTQFDTTATATGQIGLDEPISRKTLIISAGSGVVFTLMLLSVVVIVVRQKMCCNSDEPPEKLHALGPHVTRVQHRHDFDRKKYGQLAEYVNEAHYRTLFPFINDDEWSLLKESHVDRESVKCEVEFSMPIVLGTGNFGHVYRGECVTTDGSGSKKLQCAVKRLNEGYKSQDLGHFLMEAITLLKVGRHHNVVSLVGSVLLDAISDTGQDDDDQLRKPPILLMELATEGNLKNYLSERRLQADQSSLQIITQNESSFGVGKGLTYQDLMSFAFQSARGMQHLASKNIIHRDLAARNVLVTSDKTIKIADFGLSKHIRSLQQEYYRIHSPAMTPAKWTAPEALWENKFSVKSDVWSFGVLTWEIFTMGGQPYQGIPVGQLYRRLSSGYRLTKPNLSSDVVYKVMKRCWAWETDARPDFIELVEFYDGSLASVSQQPYVDFNQRADSVITSTSTDIYSKSGSDHSGSDSVFDYTDSSCGSAESVASNDKDSAFSTMSSQEGERATVTQCEIAKNNFVFSELINPVYEGSNKND